MLTAAREAGMVSRTVAALTPDDQVQDQDDEYAQEDGDVAVGGENQVSTTAESGKKEAKHSTTSKDRKKLSVEECLYLATRGGAACLNLSHKIGAFEIGMEWDAQLIRMASVDDSPQTQSSVDAAKASNDTEHETTATEPAADEINGDEGPVELWGRETWPEKVAKWLFCGDDRNTKRVFVRGRLVWER